MGATITSCGGCVRSQFQCIGNRECKQEQEQTRELVLVSCDFHFLHLVTSIKSGSIGTVIDDKYDLLLINAPHIFLYVQRVDTMCIFHLTHTHILFLKKKSYNCFRNNTRIIVKCSKLTSSVT